MTKYRPEYYRWKSRIYDISMLLEDIEQGIIHPITIDLSSTFISKYCELYLDSSAPAPRPQIQTNQTYADLLPSERLLVPIIFLHVGENEGIVSLREDVPEPNYVVIDGNHRLLAAKRSGVALKAYVVSAEHSEIYGEWLE